MNPENYNRYLTQEKARLLTEKGSFLGEKKLNGKYVLVTYQLFDFFVEILYSQSDHQIQNILAKSKIEN